MSQVGRRPAGYAKWFRRQDQKRGHQMERAHFRLTGCPILQLGAGRERRCWDWSRIKNASRVAVKRMAEVGLPTAINGHLANVKEAIN